MKEKKIFNVAIEEGDAIIRLRHNKVVQLVFAEDVIRLLEKWHGQTTKFIRRLFNLH